ncbi:peptide chain release factor N(5)-glutamine methyltransferase [Mucilaginibacter sp. 21P]|uniref:peptide chain release factor N(5)-glutamine methyltransferase n=1 Tax=Mucilaginibacter sp. 21P TaxID=2778902 RepID=UPI001C57F2E7|nr:peptide chain release factor N(5)-glutamine methyltransferase [Mucilaginibacter sp. 21P]QXV64657.1 peptide chain release factor N(5)-glutamine methyltransferase [Mucilaginibacter sp. 21P]
MKTIKDAVLSFKNQLNDLYGPQEAEAIAMLVLQELTGMSRAKLKAFEDDDLPSETVDKLPQILQELSTGKPVQYILGSTEFYGLQFLVNAATLIPRPETEELVAWILESQKLKVQDQRSLQILDIGTGTGCIAITLSKNITNAHVSAVDISMEALRTAERNAMINEAKVDFHNVDILDKNNYQVIDNRYDIIVSNPPYVTPADKLKMHANVTDFEPHTALFVPEEEPLKFYIAIADFANTQLDKDGLLFFEINEAFGKETSEMLIAKGFDKIELRQDMSGRDRMIKALKA